MTEILEYQLIVAKCCHDATQIRVNIGLGNGLLPGSIKSLRLYILNGSLIISDLFLVRNLSLPQTVGVNVRSNTDQYTKVLSQQVAPLTSDTHVFSDWPLVGYHGVWWKGLFTSRYHIHIWQCSTPLLMWWHLNLIQRRWWSRDDVIIK